VNAERVAGLSAGIITLVSEMVKRSDKLGALLAALPFVSIITLFFLKEIPLRGGRRRQDPVAEAVQEALAEESGLPVAD